MIQNKMFGFIKKIFMTAIAFIGWNAYNAMNAIPLKLFLRAFKSVEKDQS